MIWHTMREAALIRHAIVNAVMERGCPVRWEWHKAIVRGFYGY
jgi:hypothetical protein